jgi:hypothetical protein
VTLARLHALARRRRRRLAVLAVMLSLAGAVVVAHSVLGEGHMGDGTATCLAVMTVGGVALLGLTRAPAAVLRAPLSSPLPLVAPAVVALPAPVPRSRAGPAVLQVFVR